MLWHVKAQILLEKLLIGYVVLHLLFIITSLICRATRLIVCPLDPGSLYI